MGWVRRDQVPQARRRNGQAPPWGDKQRALPSGAPGPCEQVQAGGAANLASLRGSADDVTGEVTRIGQGQAPPNARSPRRLRAETTFPGRQRIPSAETTSSVPP